MLTLRDEACVVQLRLYAVYKHDQKIQIHSIDSEKVCGFDLKICHSCKMKSLTVCALFIVFGLACCSTEGPVVVGGWSDGDLGDSIVQQLSTYAISQTAENGAECAEAFTPTKVETQVVAGMKYKITYNVDPSKCPNNKDATTRNCAIEVVDQPWLNNKEILSNTCKITSKVE